MPSATIGDAVHAPCHRAHRLASVGAGVRAAPASPCATASPSPCSARGALAAGPELADLRPVGVDHLGPRDRPPGPVDVDGPSWKPLPVLLTTPFALFGGARAGPLAVRGARGRARRRRRCRSALGRRLGGAARRASRPPRLRARARGRCATARWATPRACSSRSCSPRSNATSTAGRAPAFLLGLGAALLRPEVWPFLGLYGALAAVARRRAARARRRGLRRRCPRSGSCRSGGARATPCGRRTAPRARARTAPPSPTTRCARCSSSSTTMITPVVWVGLAALGLAVLCASCAAAAARRSPRSASSPRCSSAPGCGSSRSRS